MAEQMTTRQWMDLPVTVEDVDFLDQFLHEKYGILSMWPWPHAAKVLAFARQAVALKAAFDEQGVMAYELWVHLRDHVKHPGGCGDEGCSVCEVAEVDCGDCREVLAKYEQMLEHQPDFDPVAL